VLPGIDPGGAGLLRIQVIARLDFAPVQQQVDFHVLRFPFPCAVLKERFIVMMTLIEVETN
jgi:hypothetical protein